MASQTEDMHDFAFQVERTFALSWAGFEFAVKNLEARRPVLICFAPETMPQ